MRIGFFGNVNCCPFRYARELKKQGHEIVFFIHYPQSNRLNRPEYRFIGEIEYPYPDWVVELKPMNKLKWVSPNFFSGRALNILNTCDAVFLNDVGIALRPFIKDTIPSICICTGADLDVATDWKMLFQLSERSIKQILRKAFLSKMLSFLIAPLIAWSIYNQRKGIRKSCVIEYFPTGISPHADILLANIKRNRAYVRNELRGFNVDDVPYLMPTKKDIITIFNPTRFLWKVPLPAGYTPSVNKRNDIMINGIALFYKNTGLKMNINFVEKGDHVDETKNLCDAVGISSMITWHKELNQKDIFKFYAQSDICFDQLGSHWVGAGGLDAMLTGRPVIANGRSDIYINLFGAPLPVCQATTPEEVADWLLRLCPDLQLRIGIGKRGREFIIKHYDIHRVSRFFVSQIELEKRGYR